MISNKHNDNDNDEEKLKYKAEEKYLKYAVLNKLVGIFTLFKNFARRMDPQIQLPHQVQQELASAIRSCSIQSLCLMHPPSSSYSSASFPQGSPSFAVSSS